jgi:GntR family transcriptional regulator
MLWYSRDDLPEEPWVVFCCTICNSTDRLIPFRLTFEPGIALWEQIVYAARKAVVSGQMRPGDAFPSVRALSTELKINPNTAHKVVAFLLAEGLLEVRVGLGTVVAQRPRSTATERSRLLMKEVEQLVVEAKRLGLDLDEVRSAIESHWDRLTDPAEEITGAKKRS